MTIQEELDTENTIIAQAVHLTLEIVYQDNTIPADKIPQLVEAAYHMMEARKCIGKPVSAAHTVKWLLQNLQDKA